MNEEEARRREQHRAQLRAALPADFEAAPRVDPFAPQGPMPPRTQRPPGIPEFFARGLGEAARHTGNAIGGAMNSVNDWHMNRGREVMAMDDERKRIEAEYLPQIREANRGQQRASNAALGMWAPEKEFVQRADRGNQYIGNRMDAAIFSPQRSPFSGSAPPEELSDEELMAELEALGRGGPR